MEKDWVGDERKSQGQHVHGMRRKGTLTYLADEKRDVLGLHLSDSVRVLIEVTRGETLNRRQQRKSASQ